MPLTKRQHQVLEFVTSFIATYGYSPSYEEIARALGVSSVATVYKHIRALEARGCLRRGVNRSRSLKPKTSQESAASHEGGLTVPLIGRIAAGLPVEAFPDQRPLDLSSFIRWDRTYALEVKGDSMIEDHICDGDIVLVERTQTADEGDIVVALVDGSESTLKRFYREPDGRIRLQPANSQMEAIVIPADKVQIQGRVLAVLRRYR